MSANKKRLIAVISILLSIILALGTFLICRWQFSYTADVLWANDDNGYINPISQRDIALATQLLDDKGIAYELVNNNTLLLVQQCNEEKAVDLLQFCKFDSSYVEHKADKAVIESARSGFHTPVLMGNENNDYHLQPLSSKDIERSGKILSDNGIEYDAKMFMLLVQEKDAEKAVSLLSGVDFDSCYVSQL